MSVHGNHAYYLKMLSTQLKGQHIEVSTDWSSFFGTQMLDVFFSVIDLKISSFQSELKPHKMIWAFVVEITSSNRNKVLRNDIKVS